MKMSDILENLAFGRDLDKAQAQNSFSLLFNGEMTDAQAGAFLMGLKCKGETALELSCAVKEALKHALIVEDLKGTRIDTVGTGGDGASSFNCSTAVSLLLAAMGYQVVKHGNRSVSSTCGSADALEALGISLDKGPETVAASLGQNNFAFLFAPRYHPAFKHIMPVRQEIGCRTLFNLLGPLLNPARPTHQLLGVALPDYLLRMGQVLAESGIESACVVHGAGGLDELTTFGENRLVWVREGWIREDVLNPGEYGFKTHDREAVAVDSKEQAVSVLRKILAGTGPAAMVDMVVLNLGVCLHMLEKNLDLKEAFAKARNAVDSKIGEKLINA